jgi:hypothetical protein
MNLIARILVALAGLFCLFMTVLFWFQTNSALESFGLLASNAAGLGAARADFAAFFGVQALFAGLTVWKGRGEYALPPLALMSFAIFGRALSLIMSGMNEAVVSGMVVEAICIAIFAFAWRTLRA